MAPAWADRKLSGARGDLQKHRIDLQMKTDTHLPRLTGDRTQLQQVLREQRFRHSRFHDGASAERDHPLFQKVRLSEMVLIDALAA